MSTPKFIGIDELYRLYRSHPSVCTDSRKLEPGDLFFALKGPHFDGNDYALKALAAGAAYAVVSRPELAGQDARCLLTKDSEETLRELAKVHRRTLDIPLIAITGTNGKTTTKELVREVLSRKYRVVATEGNLNNHIGVPLTLLRIAPEHEVAVIEMGASGLGEIELLASIASPTIGVITNVGKAHLEGFGSQEGVLDAKSELFEYIESTHGTILLNTDDPLLCKRWYGRSTDTYGLLPIEGHRHIVTGRVASEGAFLELFVTTDTECLIRTHLIGRYNSANVLATVAVGRTLGVDMDAIVDAIEGYAPSNNRSQLVLMARDIDAILDCYNANPSSMLAALENIAMTSGRHKWVVLGDMLELGDESLTEHRRIVEWLMRHPDIQPIMVGREFGKALGAVKSDGEALSEQFLYFESSEALLAFMENVSIPEGTIILVKGSRGMALERCKPLLEAAAEK